MRRAALLLGLLVAMAVTHGPVLAQQRIAPVQTTTVVTRARLLLAADRMMYDRWYPAAVIPPPPTHPDDRGTLTAAVVSDDPSLRGLALRLIGRFEDPADLPALLPFVGDRNPAIREAALLAVAQSLSTSASPDTDAVVDLFEARALQEPSQQVVDAVLGAMGSLEYGGPAFKRVETRLVSLIRPTHERVPNDRRSAVAIDALEHLYQRNPGRTPSSASLTVLLTLAKPLPPQMPVEAALRILRATGTATHEVVTYAARFFCVYAPPQGPPPPIPRCEKTGGARVRLLGLQMMPPDDPANASYFEEAAEDSAFPELQAEAFRKLAAGRREKIRCQALLDVTGSGEPENPERILGKLSAIDLIDPKCEEIAEVVAILKRLVERLSDQSSDRQWHVPARALVKLAMIAPAEAAPFVTRLAAPSDVWQVRIAAADAAQLTGDQAVLLQLTSDDNPNVRSEAISALARLHSPAVAGPALKALESDDFQLVMVGAVALRELRAEDERVSAAAELQKALERLTRDASDTSRTARFEILQRFKEFARPDETGRSALIAFRSGLDPLLRDFDPVIAAAAADVIGEMSGARPAERPTYRPPTQPTEADLDEVSTLAAAYAVGPRSLRTPVSVHAVLELDDGHRVPLLFMKDETPVAVARFLNLARDGYYNGQTFYVTAGTGPLSAGSPGANDYSAGDRFWRDEIASPAISYRTAAARMAQGAGPDGDDLRMGIELLTHGRDHGDGRFALAPLGSRSRFTVLAEVRGGLGIIPEGTKIVRVLVPSGKTPR